MKRFRRFIVLVAVSSIALLTSGCSFSGNGSSRTSTVYKEVVVERPSTPPPGTVQFVWEEPMVDVVDVPPGLDPEGNYYRPAHQEVIEIRQGRWRVQKLKRDRK